MYTGKDYEKNLQRLKTLTSKQKNELFEIEQKAIARFQGTLDELETALGMLRIGYHVGWRVLVLIHDRRTIKKYEEILGISIKEIFSETGPSSERCRGYIIASKLKDFWKAVRGEVKIEGRREIAK